MMYGLATDSTYWMKCQSRAIERRRLERLTLGASAVAMLAITAAAWGLS